MCSVLSVITLFTFPFFLFLTLDSAFGIQFGSLAGISAHCWGLFNQWGMYKEGHESSQERDTRECVELELEAGGYIDLAPHQAAAAATTARTVKIQRYVAKEFNDPSILGHCVDYVKQLSAPIWAGKCALALREAAVAAAVVNRNRIAHFAGCLLKHANAFSSSSAGTWPPLSVCLTRWLS